MFVGGETDPDNTEYTVDGKTFNYLDNGLTTVGIYPFYEAVYHQIVNGYPHFDINTPSTYETNRANNLIYTAAKDNYGRNQKYYSTFS